HQEIQAAVEGLSDGEEAAPESPVEAADAAVVQDTAGEGSAPEEAAAPEPVPEEAAPEEAAQDIPETAACIS
ncbi:hypothetical protein H6B15_15375, partial [Gemmiger formicilis]|nr:hypothetical protein [Gemmiger formicilis]